MSRRLIFNVDFEERLAGRSTRLKPSFLKKLAARFLFLGTAEDTLEGDFELPAAFRARFPDLPRVAKDAAGERLEWAPSEPPELMRRLNAKPFAYEVAKRIGLAMPGTLCRSVEEVAASLPDGRWVVKRPFGHGALGHFLGAGSALPPNAPGSIAKALATGEPVVLEPWVEREQDWSVQLEVGESVRVLAVTELITTPQGAYVGNRIGVPGPSGEAAIKVGEILRAEGYRGPAGIDAYTSGGVLRPLVEINARHTMGRIALEVARRLGHEVASWLTLPGPLRFAPSGPWWEVTDPFADEPGPATVLVWGRSREELIEREGQVRGF